MVFRLLLAGLFMQHAVTEFLGHFGVLGAYPWRSTAHMIADSLLIVIGIWLAFGIRSRVVAALGVLLFIMPYLLESHLVVLPRETATMIAAILLAIPVLLCGGGRHALLRRGWRWLS